jgi:hypothetical protein
MLCKYSLGDWPVTRLNDLLKAVFELKPASKATAKKV